MRIRFNFTWRIWMLIIVLFFSFLSISGVPFAFFEKGVLVTSVSEGSKSFELGLREGQIISAINGEKILGIEDYSKIINDRFPSNGKVKTIIQTKESEFILFSNSSPEITVSQIPKTNIQTGLDISGGARALVEAEDRILSDEEAKDLSKIIERRLNFYGIEDIKVSPISDFSGNNFVKIEIAGATPDDLRNLISEQGKFEAKIGNETIFVGGERDITSVARSGQDALIESCTPLETEGYFCNFRFTIFLSQEAAERHADVTEKIDVNFSTGGEYLSKTLDLFLDDNLVDTLLIGTSLKGRVTTQISISGSGSGLTEDQAYDNSIEEMTQLQTVLITGSLPFKLKLSKLDTVSPSLGEEFTNSILLAGLTALLVVSVIIFFRYRNFKSSIALLFTSLSEVVIILGIASLINWNLDLPSIAGILATIGTGIDQQIIIIDEAKNKSRNINQRMKMAFAIIIAAYFTAVVAMIPLYWAAAGFFKGFAITTIIGITSGVLITRPAFSDMIKKIEG
tara:strand:- start:5047 stop:6579 length:1533 start_codon:yes stop_codon:yes gene_type:complete